jgi:cytochrome c peroxidase
MRLRRPLWLLVAVLLTVALGWRALIWLENSALDAPWTTAELATIRSLSLAGLEPLPADSSNRVADDPDAAELGRRLFFDRRLSANGAVACSTCHQPERYFTDGRARSVGLGMVEKNAMTVVGAAYSPWYFWDGRRDSLWAQAAAPIEHPLEQGLDRLALATIIAQDPDYRRRYEALFGALPGWLTTAEGNGRFFQGESLQGESGEGASGPPGESAAPGAPEGNWERLRPGQRTAVTRVLANVGKALAAFQRLLRPAPGRFDEYVANLSDPEQGDPAAPFSAQERRGLRLFIGRGQCTNCHNGPLLTNNSFHNTGSLNSPGLVPSVGRISGVVEVLNDPLNCLGEFNDDERRSCAELRFVKVGDELLGAHRTPSLRNVALTAPYMHAGQIPTLDAAVAQYNVAADAMVGHNEAKPLGLSGREQAALVAFLRTLDGGIATDSHWLSAPSADGRFAAAVQGSRGTSSKIQR